MFFNLIKEINRLKKELNMLLSKEMSNIYLKVTTEEKKWRSQNFDFQGLKNVLHCNIKVRALGAKLCVVFLLFSFWKELWHFKVKESMHFFEEKYKFKNLVLQLI